VEAPPAFRRGNEAIARAAASAGVQEREIDFICECADEECLAPVPLTLHEYRQARESNTASIVAVGHADPTISSNT
jgi:hypothetical protein